MKMKTKTKKNKSKASRRTIEIVNHLPAEITIDILSRLPVESILQCKLVCKTWPTLIGHPSFTHTLHLQHRLEDYQGASSGKNKMGFIFLVGSETKRGKELHYVEYDYYGYSSWETPSRLNLNIPADTSCIVGSCNGLICISIEHQGSQGFFSDPVYICNPITGECINLPILELDTNKRRRDSTVIGFGYQPLTNEYKVVRIYYSINLDSGEVGAGQVEVCTLGSSGGWRKKGEITYLFYYYSSLGIFANGALYWMEHKGGIVAFDLADEEFQLLPPTPWYESHKYRSELRLFQGSLSVVRSDSVTMDIWSLNKKNHEWECLVSMDERSLDRKNRRWVSIFNIKIGNRTFEDYVPFAYTKTGEVLLCYHHRFFGRCDPKTSTFKVITNYNADYRCSSFTPHMSSFVSLRALLEEDGMMIGSVEEMARKYYLIN